VECKVAHEFTDNDLFHLGTHYIVAFTQFDEGLVVHFGIQGILAEIATLKTTQVQFFGRTADGRHHRIRGFSQRVFVVVGKRMARFLPVFLKIKQHLW